jgi:hypothetical protein
LRHGGAVAPAGCVRSGAGEGAFLEAVEGDTVVRR